MSTELVAIIPKKQKYANIVWQVNNLCNYRCEYCNEGNWSGEHLNLNKEKIIAGLEKIYDYYLSKNYKLLKIYFSGGEPTYWKPLIDIIKHAKQTNFAYVNIGINTNFSTKKRWWEKNCHLFDDVVASYHPQFADDDQYINNYIFLEDKINYLCARMMMHEPYWDKVLAFKKKLQNKATNFRVEYVPIFDELLNTTKPYNYKDKSKEAWLQENNFETNIQKSPDPIAKRLGFALTSTEVYIDSQSLIEVSIKNLNSNRVIAEGNNFFYGWKCFLPECIFIRADGSIDLGTCGAVDTIGSLYTDFEFPKNEFIICPKNHCFCGTDIGITKMNEEKYNG